jgi:phosphoglycerol transferase
MYRHIIKLVLYFAGLFLIAFALWTSKYFGIVSIDHALSIVVFSVQGLIEGNVFFTKRFIEWCLFWPAVGTLLIANVPLANRIAGHVFRKKLPDIIVNHIFWRYFNLLLIVAGLVLVNHQYNIIDYIIYRQNHHSDFFAEHYVYPAKVNLSAKQPKSLVLIYVESLETTYSNTSLFRNDLLQRLTHLNVNNISFSHYQEMPGTNWSIAGIIATQCAVPLKLSARIEDTYFGKDVDILPRVQCLGDILAANGYRNIYMNGSRLNFAGVGRFLKDHHYSELYGREKWVRSGILTKKQMTHWGLPDDLLLALAKIRLGQLVKDQQPFNLTLFMIDTHGLSGQLSQTCAKAGYTDFEGIVECTANQVADFVSYVEKQGWLDKMNIVIVGDHLAMKNLVSNKLSSVKKRYIFNMIISNNKLSKNTEEVVPFDMLPTMLTSLGFQYQAGRLGLGYAAIGTENKNRPKNRMQMLKQNLLYESKTYNQLWVR